VTTFGYHEQMQVVVEDRGRVAVVRPAGDVDIMTCGVLRESLDALDRDVVVDLSGVPFMDSSGLGVLAMQRRRLEAAGSTLRLANPTDLVAHLLQVTGLEFWLSGDPPDD
jgi:anti-sigma B factor antagonist